MQRSIPFPEKLISKLIAVVQESVGWHRSKRWLELRQAEFAEFASHDVTILRVADQSYGNVSKRLEFALQV